MRMHELAAMCLSLGLTVHFSVAVAQPQNASGNSATGNPPAVQEHLDAANAAAGTEHLSALNRACLLDEQAGRNNLAGGQPPPDSDEVDPLAEPTKVFDNLYYVGLVTVASWAVTTGDGIILIDALNHTSDAEVAIVPGLRKLGLDPADIKYIVVTHGHGDHYGGAKYLSETYGAQVLMGAADWDELALPRQRRATPPSRGLDALNGQQLTLGDTTITIVATPGHTPGTISLLVPVWDNGERHMAAMWGGNGMRDTPEQMMQFVASLDRFEQYTSRAQVDVLLTNHGPYQDLVDVRLPATRARTAGAPNPLVIGEDSYRSYMRVFSECAKAQLERVLN